MYQIKTTFELAIKFENSGYYRVAYPLFKECLKRNIQDQGEVYLHCGLCLEKSKESEKQLAIRYYLEAGKSKSNPLINMKGYFRAGMLFMNLNNTKDALKCFKQVIELGHSEGEYGEIYSDAIYYSASCLELEEKYKEALKLFRALKNLSQKLNPEIQYHEIKCLLALGLRSKALSLYRNTKKIKKDQATNQKSEKINWLPQNFKRLTESNFEINDLNKRVANA